ncbi:MAG: lysophospholipase [Olsenella sp.]|nr:lysophospholipase [Olsenella sp.]
MTKNVRSMARRYETEFDSADSTSRINASVWWSENPLDTVVSPKGVVQIVHGMAEHIERYDEFARFLVDAGYLVCGHNQIGHGASAPKERWGCLPARGGRQILVEDVHSLRKLVTKRVRNGTPHYVFGHSMGSFITRSYISRYGGGLAGAIICGTGFVPVATSRAGRTLARIISRLRGEDHKSELLHSMADGSYSKALEGAKTDFDWLSRNEENVKRYMADEACGFMFSAGGYATLTDLTAEVCTLECAQRVPHQLPLLFIAGAEDPVGDMGEGVTKAADLARQAGSADVTCKIYHGMRHEILNEKDRRLVFGDVLAWLDDRTKVADETRAIFMPAKTPEEA